MKTIKYLSIFLSALVLCGCQAISIMSSPNGVHKVVEAKVDLSESKKVQFAIIVDYPGKVSSGANLHYKITQNVASELKEHLKVSNIVKYSEVAKLRGSMANFNQLSAYQLGEYLQADIVIVVTIDDYSLYELPLSGYYSGSMCVSAALFDINQEYKLWPTQAIDSRVELNIEAAKGQEKLANKLTLAAAHCVVRNFYNCRTSHYKVLEEKIDLTQGEW